MPMRASGPSSLGEQRWAAAEFCFLRIHLHSQSGTNGSSVPWPVA